MAVTPESSSHPSALLSSFFFFFFTARLSSSALIQLPLFLLSSFCFSLRHLLRLASQSQAHWLFQRPTRSKPWPASTTAAGPAASCPSRRELLCSSTSERLMTGGRGGITEWTDWCPTSTLWSKTSKTLFFFSNFFHVDLASLIFGLMVAGLMVAEEVQSLTWTAGICWRRGCPPEAALLPPPGPTWLTSTWPT